MNPAPGHMPPQRHATTWSGVLQHQHPRLVVDRAAQTRTTLITKDQVISAIKNTLDDHGIDLPFPTQQILFRDQTEETDDDRSSQREGWPAGKGPSPIPRTIAGTLRSAGDLKQWTAEENSRPAA